MARLRPQDREFGAGNGMSAAAASLRSSKCAARGYNVRSGRILVMSGD